MFILKENSPDITVVDGPFAGRTYKSGQAYADIPPEEAEKFETVAEETPLAQTKMNKQPSVIPKAEKQAKED